MPFVERVERRDEGTEMEISSRPTLPWQGGRTSPAEFSKLLKPERRTRPVPASISRLPELARTREFRGGVCR